MNEITMPVDFDGIFKFTNFTDHEFKTRWNNIEYTFPAKSTSPLVIPSATSLEIQSIRKKFARDLAVEEFYTSEKFNRMNDVKNGTHPALYTESDIAPYVQRCLEPLPIQAAKLKAMPTDSEDNYSKDRKGENVSKIVEPGDSLIGNGAVIG